MGMPNFVNISVNGTIRATLEGNYEGKTSADLILDFIECAEDGLKFSFSYKESKRAYCVAITLPDVRAEGEFVCATFWDGELFDALLEAHLVLFEFGAAAEGLYHAKSEISRYEKQVGRVIQQMREEGNTTVKTRLIP